MTPSREVPAGGHTPRDVDERGAHALLRRELAGPVGRGRERRRARVASGCAARTAARGPWILSHLDPP
jgi:hypothetical protein